MDIYDHEINRLKDATPEFLRNEWGSLLSPLFSSCSASRQPEKDTGYMACPSQLKGDMTYSDIYNIRPYLKNIKLPHPYEVFNSSYLPAFAEAQRIVDKIIPGRIIPTLQSLGINS